MDDLEQYDEWTYIIVKGKRVTLPENAEEKDKLLSTYDGPIVTRKIKSHVVPYLTEKCWARHGYKLSDIELTMRQLCSRHLWPLSRLYRIPLDSSAVKAAFSSETGMVWGAKLAAIRQNINHIAQIKNSCVHPPDPNHAILWHKYKEREHIHKPFIPLHAIDDATYKEYINAVPAQICYDLTAVPRIVTWKDIQAVPIRVEQKELVLMTRVIPEDLYYKKHGRPAALVHIPPTIQLPDGSKYCLLRESFFLVGQSLYPRYLNAMLHYQNQNIRIKREEDE